MSDCAPSQQVSDWLSRFGATIECGDFARAASMFQDECYWRDLVSFTWNIKTLEGRSEIAAILAATAGTVKPSNWQIEGDATTNNGVTEGWFTFQTAVA